METIIKSLLTAIIAFVILCAVAFGVGCVITGTYDVTQWFQSQSDTGGDDRENPDNFGDNGNNSGDNGADGNAVCVADDDRLIVRIENSEGLSLACTRIMPNDYKSYGITTLADSAFILKATVKDDSGKIDESIQYVTFLPYTSGGGVPPDYVIEGRAIDDTTYLIIVDDLKSFELLTKPGMNKQICVMAESRLDKSKTAFARLEYEAVQK